MGGSSLGVPNVCRRQLGFGYRLQPDEAGADNPLTDLPPELAFEGVIAESGPTEKIRSASAWEFPLACLESLFFQR